MADIANDSEQSPLSIEQVLYEEAEALLGGERFRAAARSAPHLGDQKAQNRRTFLNADAHAGDIPVEEARRRETFYRWLNGLNRAALCCSGGGIRSATFCLGVIQALTGHDVAHGPRLSRRGVESATDRGGESVERETLLAATADDGSVQIVVEREQWLPEDRSSGKASAVEDADRAGTRPAEPANSLLGRFHFLSTVSGGGYVGSWLSSWRKHDHFDAIIRNLTGRPKGADVEPPEISWLRAYSNYLTPRIGIGSADTWAAIAIVVRNLLLNWLVIVPVYAVHFLP